MSWWISEDSEIDDYKAVKNILGNFCAHFECYLDFVANNDEECLEDYDMSPKYLSTVEEFIQDCRKHCDRLETALNKVKQL